MSEGPKRMSEIQDPSKKRLTLSNDKNITRIRDENSFEPLKSTKDMLKSDRQPIITKITTQKQPGRYNIFIDEKFAFGVDEQIIVDYMLAKGKEIPQSLQEKIKSDDLIQKGYQRALNYLSHQLRSEKEIRDDLIEKEYGSVQDDVIDKLKKLKLIDDKSYAESFVRTKARINQHGPRTIQHNLLKKGIDEKTAEAALDEYEPELMWENIKALGEKQIKKSKKRSSFETEQKVRQYLLQKGYDYDLIQEILPELQIEKDEVEERKALEKQGEKAWRRYSKFELDECRQKTFANLFGKGFPSDLIQEFIDKKEREWQDG